MNQTQQYLTNTSTSMIHRAPWVIVDVANEVYPDTRGIIEDGALVIDEGVIRAVGKAKAIISEYAGIPVRDHGNRALAAPLINGHCHLELSYMDLAGSKARQAAYSNDPTEWIRDLLRARDEFGRDPDGGEKGLHLARQVLDQMNTEGVGFVGDIGNSLASRTIGRDKKTKVNFLLELLGLAKESEEHARLRLESVATDPAIGVSCTAHAPYSTTPGLILELKRIADRHGSVFSIHVAESQQEVEFLQKGSGKFLDFLKERGAWDKSFTVPGVGPVLYLENLGVLNGNTICVHAVHVSSEEIAILASRKAKVCLCPGSNRFLGVGKAPVTELLDHGILPALGTDSRASNPFLSIWREMHLLREDHPSVSPETVFSMATRGGAEAWGIVSEAGTLDPGKPGRVISIECGPDCRSGHDLLEYITTAGGSVQVEWIG